MTRLTAHFGLAAVTVAGLGVLSVWLSQASAGQPAAQSDKDPLQIVADVVLIEAECRSLNVDYGKLFAFEDRNGINPVDILPTGARRAAFEAAYRHRVRDTPGDQLCGRLAAERAGAIPGVFTQR